MLRQLRLTNFKSFAGSSDSIPLAPVTILVGANASGKSNLFDAIRFLQGVGRGFSIAEILIGKYEGGRKVFDGLRGGVAEVCWRGEDRFEIESWCRIGLGGEKEPESLGHAREFHHRIACDVKDSPQVHSEDLLVDGEYTFRQLPRSWEQGRDGGPDAQGQLGKGPEEELTYTTEMPYSASVVGRFSTHEKYERTPTARNCAVLKRLYAQTRFLELTPSAMREFVSPQAPELGECGENLSGIVHQICNDENKKEQFRDWLSALCAPVLTDIRFARNDVLEVLVQLVEGDGEERILSARSISDGTLRFMGLLAAMFSAPEGSLFLIEEIENGLHPTRAHLIVELMEQFAEARRIQVIATTHSSQVLLGLSETALKNAVLFARRDDVPGTITRRLGDLTDFEEVTGRTNIDQLFATGWLEHVV